MLRNSVICRSLAAAAVLAVTAGCTAQAAVGRPAGADAKPGGSAPAQTGTATPSASDPATPKPKGTTGKPREPAGTARTEVLMANGSKGERVRELQARLAQIGWFDDRPTGTYGSVTVASVKGFQGKRGLPATGDTDTMTWQKLLGMTTKPTRDELNGATVNKPAAKLDPRCMTGRVMCISKTTRTLSWVIDGKVRSTMDVRFGSQYTPTREGTFSVFQKSRDHVSTIYHTSMPYAMFFSGGQAVHYSSDFAARGYNGASHGCVNVRNKGKIASLFAQVHSGDKVVIYW
ncbi:MULTISPECIES: L,D-transpeptidase family protein [unclassified Streptomyces]|uniref:L,D-transpeptidase family protein n=1 Tax=unclassified Streptomyces TaxID=2593676 RepID=UPI002DDC0133|nr:L,D-transpeptidase family protein [Streptomyces sp. NBC_01750]WSB00733.1 L,D-transpeptidase family protein [Streptomyces sp. NBC_01794]WSD34910.1 L,D-transpeptidase family protein [Streptomyces sp. NBC_01750]